MHLLLCMPGFSNAFSHLERHRSVTERLKWVPCLKKPRNIPASRDRPKSGPYLRLRKHNAFKIVKGDPLETFKNFGKRSKKRFLNNVPVPKNVKGDPLRFFNIHSVAKYRNKSRDNWCNPNIYKKRSHSVEKIQVKNTKIAKGGFSDCFRGSGCRFCFFLFWTRF